MRLASVQGLCCEKHSVHAVRPRRHPRREVVIQDLFLGVWNFSFLLLNVFPELWKINVFCCWTRRVWEIICSGNETHIKFFRHEKHVQHTKISILRHPKTRPGQETQQVFRHITFSDTRNKFSIKKFEDVRHPKNVWQPKKNKGFQTPGVLFLVREVFSYVWITSCFFTCVWNFRVSDLFLLLDVKWR